MLPEFHATKESSCIEPFYYMLGGFDSIDLQGHLSTLFSSVGRSIQRSVVGLAHYRQQRSLFRTWCHLATV